MKPFTLEQAEQLPKVDLHLHLDGALSAEAIWKIAQEHGVEIPGISEQTLEALSAVYPNPGPFSAGERPEEFNRFLDMFGMALSVMQTPKTIGDATRAVIRDLERENTFYAELRFAPSYHVNQGHSMDAMVEAILAAMKAGQEETGVMTKLILIIPREIATQGHPQGITAEDIAQVALKYQEKGVVAIDLACSEFYAPEPYIKAFRMTFDSTLKRTVHAGEAGPRMEENITMAIPQMWADGLGHALPLPTMPDAMRMVKQQGVRVERTPLSNKAMTAGDGDFDGLDQLVDSGALVSIGSDDPGIFGPSTSLSANYHAVAERYGWGRDELMHLTRNAVMSAFVSDEEREALLLKLD